MIIPANIGSLPAIVLEDVTGPLTEVGVAEGKNIIEIITNAFTGMLTGTLGGVKQAFDSIVLNEAGTGLSMLSIWTLVFFGVGLLPRGYRLLMSFFHSRKAKV